MAYTNWTLLSDAASIKLVKFSENTHKKALNISQILHVFLSSADFFKIYLFEKKNLSGILSECETANGFRSGLMFCRA